MVPSLMMSFVEASYRSDHSAVKMMARTLVFQVRNSLAFLAVQGGKTLLVGFFFLDVVSECKRVERSSAVWALVALISWATRAGMYDREFSVLEDSVWIELGGGVVIVDCVDGNWMVIHWEG